MAFASWAELQETLASNDWARWHFAIRPSARECADAFYRAGGAAQAPRGKRDTRRMQSSCLPRIASVVTAAGHMQSAATSLAARSVPLSRYLAGGLPAL